MADVGDADRLFTEIATFPALGAASFSFAFELSIGKGQQTRQDDDRKETRSTAFRLQALSRQLKHGSNPLSKDTPYELLVEPVRSFLDDVTNGIPGVNGRPLIFLASAAPPDDPSRSLTLVRPDHWDYSYEGEITRMQVPAGSRRLAMWLRDSFCVFESGRIYYVLTLLQEGDQPFDEYAVIQFEQLILKKERDNARNERYLGFERNGSNRPLSLVALANERLQELREPAPGDATSAVVDLMKPFGLIGPDEHLRAVSTDHLSSLCIGIEDATLFRTAEFVHDKLDRNRIGRKPTRPKEVCDMCATWDATTRGMDAQSLHLQPDNPIERPLLVVAGIATGVPDFPYQDDSEVHDSTRLAARSTESTLYSHPDFLLEIGKSWRSFREGADDIGTCPYLMMTWLVTAHDEATIAKMEQLVDDMIYHPTKTKGHQPGQPVRAEPMADVMQLLRSASDFRGQKTRVQEANLARRLELFRWESIHRCGNMFRYPKEKAALTAVRAERGIDERFEEVHATIDRLENLVEDVSSLASAYSAGRTNRLLGTISILGIVGLPGNLVQSFQALSGAQDMPYRLISLTILVLLVALYFSRRSNKTRG